MSVLLHCVGLDCLITKIEKHKSINILWYTKNGILCEFDDKKKISMVSVAIISCMNYDWLLIAIETMFIFLAALFIVILTY